MTDYRELTMTTPRSVSDAQRARALANESLPSVEWSVKRDALVASGLVAERAQPKVEPEIAQVFDPEMSRWMAQNMANANANSQTNQLNALLYNSSAQNNLDQIYRNEP